MSSTPPLARKIPTERVHHGDVFVDDYEWMREKESPELVAHLEAENAYADAQTDHLAPLREQLFDEIKNRTQETDLSVPVREDRRILLGAQPFVVVDHGVAVMGSFCGLLRSDRGSEHDLSVPGGGGLAS